MADPGWSGSVRRNSSLHPKLYAPQRTLPSAYDEDGERRGGSDRLKKNTVRGALFVIRYEQTLAFFHRHPLPLVHVKYTSRLEQTLAYEQTVTTAGLSRASISTDGYVES